VLRNVALALAVLLLPAATGAGATRPRPAWTLAFSSDRYGAYDLWTIDSSGALQRLTATPQRSELDAAWAPDGRTIAFTDVHGFLIDVAIRRADGTTTRIRPFYEGAENTTNDSEPAWSPNGQRLAWTEGGPRTAAFVVVGAPAGRPGRELLSGQSPAWSPDGRRLAFTWNADLWTMRSDGSAPRRLTHHVGDRGYYAPSWSPDGRQLVAVERLQQPTDLDPTGASRLVLVGAGGGEPRPLGAPPETLGADHPAWSPDGSWIAFDRGHLAGQQDLYLIHPDGSGLRRLTRTARWDEAAPAWRPAG
jgi:Tol biopolymer transport system component